MNDKPAITPGPVPAAGAQTRWWRLSRRVRRAAVLARRVVAGCLEDGMIHAGNLAYLSMLAIFPFFITGAAVFSFIGEAGERAAMIDALLLAMPPVVGEAIGPEAREAVERRTGLMLWLGGLFGLWTVGSLVETLRDILHRAYRTKATGAFWKHRLASTGIILAAMLLLLVSLIGQLAISAAQQIISAFFPQLLEALRTLAWSQIATTIGLFGSIYLLFASLTPSEYRDRRFPKWPGAALVTLWWIAVSLGLPQVLRILIDYDLTYGSLAGMMIALFFFWLVGLGMVAGAQLNAALAQMPAAQQERRRKTQDGQPQPAKEDQDA